MTVTTAFSAGDPFPNRIDTSFVEPETGYVQVANTGDSTFTGQVGTIAVSANAGDLSFTSSTLVLLPDQSVSIAIPDESSVVGGFNGPAYFYRPGVEVFLTGTVARAGGSAPIDLLVADRDIHSGVVRVDPWGLSSDSFVLQGGDPWGFQNPDAYALALADGVAVLSGTVPEPASLALFGTGAVLLLASRRLRPPPGSPSHRAGRRAAAR